MFEERIANTSRSRYRASRTGYLVRVASAPRQPRAWKLRALQAAALMACAAMANAEGNPYTVGVYQAFSYDSNVFRSTDAFAQSTGWSTTGVFAGVDQPIGRQRFYANGNIAANVYDELSQLDYTSYNFAIGLDWATIEHLKGTVHVSADQRLGDYGGENDAPIRTRNIRNGTLAYASAQYGLVSLLALTGRLAYNEARYSAPEYARSDLTQRSASLGIKKQFSGQLTLGTGATYTDGAYSSGQDFDRYDVYLSGDWIATGLSTINGRLNYSKWDYTSVDPFEESSATGWMQWVYVPTGKLTFKTLLSYDTLANSGLTEIAEDGLPTQGGTNQLTTALQLGVNYAASAKVKVNASLNHYRRTNNRAFNPLPGQDVGNVETRDRVTALNLGASWTPTRNWRIGCNVSSDTRNQSSSQEITLRPYDAWGASCAVRFALR